MTTTRFVLILCIVIICIYVYSYYQIPKDLVVLQSTLTSFQFDMLREKQPIVIHDRLPNLDTLRTYWFNVNKVQPQEYTSETAPVGQWNRNRYKYMVLHPMADCEIMVTLGNTSLLADGSPDPEKVVPVVMKMQSNQVVLLPFRSYWMMATSCEKIQAFGVHDWITYFLP